MAQYSKIATGKFTASAGVSHFVNLPFVPKSFSFVNKTNQGTAADAKILDAFGYADDPAGYAYYHESLDLGAGNIAITSKAATSGGFSFIEAGTYQYGPTVAITGISKANPAVVTTAANHNLESGDVVLIYGTTGMLQVSTAMYTVTVTGAQTFTIPVDSSGFAAVATAGYMKKVLYADLYVPQGVSITAIGTGASTTITCAQKHNFKVGQEVYFVVPPAFGMTQLDTLVYNAANVVPQQAYVVSIPADNQIVVNIDSSGYTAFAYPTSAVFAAGVTLPQVLAIGDQNTGYSAVNGNQPPSPITIPGAFVANTRQGVLIGSALLPAADVIEWTAVYPDIYVS